MSETLVAKEAGKLIFIFPTSIVQEGTVERGQNRC